MTMLHVVQFSTLTDFITDITAGEVSGIYHDLVDQRVASYAHGVTSWRLATVIRALVAVGRGFGNDAPIVHVAAMTIPHPGQVELLNGQTIGPGDTQAVQKERWDRAAARHAAIIEELGDRLAEVGLWNLQRPGLLNVPNDLAQIYAENPVEEKEEAPAPTD